MNRSLGSVNFLMLSAILILGSAVALGLPSFRFLTGEFWGAEDDKTIFHGSDLFDPDPYPVTNSCDVPEVVIVPDFPKEEHLRLIGRLADGIVKYKTEEGGWWECGIKMSDKEALQDRAVVYSYEIVRAAYEASDKEGGLGFTLNPWGLAGTIRNESQFDRCALGTHPRKRAYELGLIKRRRVCISHTEEEVLAAVESKLLQKHFRKPGFDLGTAQLLSRFYPDRKGFKRMMSVRGGTEVAAFEMKRRARVNRTDRPWLYWRGTKKCGWYDAKVSKLARQLGAGPEEI